MIFFFYFFWNFLARFEYERNSGENFFSLFLGLSHPILAKNNAGNRFFNFFNFFAIFFGIFFPRLSINGIRDKNFFLSVSAYLIPFWPKITPESGFLIFLIFCYFFRNFLPQAEFERKLGQFFFLSFSAYLLPFWLKVILERDFLIFWFFFSIFFWNFHALVRNEQSSGLNFFFSLSRRIWSRFG